MTPMDTAPAEPGGTTRTIRVEALARVEGEGALHVRIRNGAVTELKFRIVEPPRFFEALLQGRDFREAPDITSRICGICPVAYILSASLAMEQARGVEVGGPLRDLRRLLYCGEWIQSHVLHAALLHAPDFLGLDDAVAITRAEPGLVEQALALKKTGNRIMEVIGGRAVHPVNTRVGGFYKAPDRAAIRSLAEPLRRGLDQAVALARRFGRFEFPDAAIETHCVSLRHPTEYAIDQGRVVSNRGLDLAVTEFLDHFDECQVGHSHALHGVARGGGGPYMVGPLARYNNNFDLLSPLARGLAAEIGLGPVCINPFRSILVRMVEVAYACEEALRLAESYELPPVPAVEVAPGPGIGHGATEAPRGICYHRYELDRDGAIRQARIVPPTSQNQPQIEEDLRRVVEANLALPDEALKWRCEQTIRNHDPCISCATHLLTLTIDRE